MLLVWADDDYETRQLMNFLEIEILSDEEPELFFEDFCLNDATCPHFSYCDDNYCEWCTESDDLFTFWNGTCASYCPTEFNEYKEDGSNFCGFPCDDEEFLVNNDMCVESCPSETDDFYVYGYGICQYICEQNYYVTWENECVEYCEDPFVPKDHMPGEHLKYCTTPCKEDEILRFDGECVQ
mmetsp:Transcript_16245/g.13852  ORF Transcript_16245/g.13852 Transcript_16245/m.13852 type:complete len:182 (+) Transcript_16245:1326-1871(+)